MCPVAVPYPLTYSSPASRHVAAVRGSSQQRVPSLLIRPVSVTIIMALTNFHKNLPNFPPDAILGLAVVWLHTGLAFGVVWPQGRMCVWLASTGRTGRAE
ncbi:hypothetical protein JB92DRAFT_3021085 [Gautieria morchelliformis]|nr:hypothetical protein JB92DRAFT_3021085 [Gautieria morchelliformis]